MGYSYQYGKKNAGHPDSADPGRDRKCPHFGKCPHFVPTFDLSLAPTGRGAIPDTPDTPPRCGNGVYVRPKIFFLKKMKSEVGTWDSGIPLLSVGFAATRKWDLGGDI